MEQRSPRMRFVLVAAVVALWMGAVLGRLGYLQLIRYPEYLARAQRQQQRIVEVSPRRGIIYDRNLRELAMSVSVDSCFAVPAEITDAQMVAGLVSTVLETSPEEIETRLKGSRAFVWIARKLDADKAERIRSLNLRGIYFQKESQRFYPKRELAAHVLGYVDIDERGLAGIEYALDQKIRGRPGRLLILADARRRWYGREGRGPDSGASVVLTLDEKIQYIVEKELEAAIQETGAQSGIIVVQDPNTGELLGVANWPRFNPNAPAENAAEARMNRAVSALYEPGSIFKIVTVAAALEEKLTRPQEVIDCQMGGIVIAGRRIRDHKPFGLLSVAQIVAKSSDVGAIKLGLRLGAPRFHDYIRAFGFGQPTGIELPGESRGLLRQVESWTPGSVGAISMGQEVGVTAVQMASAMSALANGGLLYTPRIVRELRKDGEVLPADVPLPTKVISPETAATMRMMLEAAVLDGTGKLARLDGYTAAGKTGTAQKIDPATGRYSSTEYIASFVGFAPLNVPAVTILVSLDAPRGRYHGGEVAAPIFKRVAEQVLTYLDVPQDLRVMATPQQLAKARKNRPEPAPDVSDFAPAQTEAFAAANNLAVFPTDPVAASAEAAQTVALEEGQGIAVPQLTGKTVRGVTEACLRLGLNPVLIGTGVAVEQNPGAGTRVRLGSRVTVRFARTAALVAVAEQEN
jgi:cell division protein FtsI (penicillin-binding protein 3)